MISLTKLEKKELNKLNRSSFYRSLTLSGSWNYINAQGNAMAYTLFPALKRIYKDKPQELKEAMKRNMAYFNISPSFSTFLAGVTTSMEEENAADSSFDAASINAVKASLMGPLAGIGDSLFWGTFRIITTGIGISLAEQGNILGPILFLVLFNLTYMIPRFYGFKFGYNVGAQFIQKAYQNGLINIITKAATILGLIMVGGMISSTVSISTNFAFTVSGTEYKIQEILDQIFKGMLPMLATITCFGLVRKKVSANKIIIGILILSMILAAVGFI
ncbi:PTS system mannose/fructose/sorbose family transporter subunit IID [Enterococcus faecium]|nr:PTS system mannose/fructose/sorbose family transporter subunit IID [Enterococcus faecium]MBD9831637.1 PTS system mannose/fructose/sorbose family transporter subunit IID [Enterococcus faecium]MBE8864133.1 PTS system mannose/fructose/sorbose family transporter subunit IID [Enterococcus faecium]MBW4157616.1 PTS system mannose/fructose/sorbose family transporter subunit IID [Enterococcus faecium]MBZ3648669.1 PTS system mannose/fructose/sorbose family transporter subunit IID [Enterococcus faecium